MMKEIVKFGCRSFFTNSKTKKGLKKKPPYIRLAVFSTFCGLWAYDGLLNEYIYMGAAVRFIRSIKTATLITLDYVLLCEEEADYENKLKLVHQRSANRLLQTCLLNGGLYIKVGQGCAAINHILPVEYTSTLALLEDKCLTTSKRDIERVFEKDFGVKPEELFGEFNYEAVAAASIAQVFKAKLKDGQQVAVKVQYHDLQKRFFSDLGTIILINNIVEFFFRSYSFSWMFKDVRNNLIQELNFINEGKNAERCAKDLEILSFVHIPKVHWPYTRQRVLTLEWIDAHKISDIRMITRNNLKLQDIDYKLFQMFAEQIFSSGFVHADPHSSNVLVRKSSKTGKSEIVLLDHGLYEELDVHIRKPLCEFWEATVLKDEHRMLNCAHQLGIKDHISFAQVLFQQRIRIDNSPIKTRLNESDIKYMQRLAKENFDSIMSTLKEMPPKMLFVVRNLNTVRAIGRMHGDIVNRPRVMARYAQHCLYKQKKSITGYFVWMYRRALFEYSLWTASFRRSCLNLYLKILYKLGRAPKEATLILKDLSYRS